MNWINKRVRNQEVLTGTWLNLRSSLTAEMAAKAGFGWVLIDLEHGAGSDGSLVAQGMKKLAENMSQYKL